MRTDEYGCEIFERRRRLNRSWRHFFFGSALGVGLLAGVGVTDAIFPPASAQQASNLPTSGAGVWRMPEALRADLARTGTRLPNLVSAEVEIWRRVNASLTAVLPD